MSEIILPGTSLKGTEEYTQSDYKNDILSDKIKSTFLKTALEIESPLILLDLSNTNEIMEISLAALRSFVYVQEYLDEHIEELKDEKLLYVYIITTQGLLKVGMVTERMAYKVLPSFIRDSFPDEVELYLSEDGVDFKDMKQSKIAKIKFTFEE